MRRRVIYWYHFYLNQPGGSIIAKTIQEVCYCKGLTNQAELYHKPCKICQHQKKGNTLYRHLPHKNIAELRPWDPLHADLIGPYIKYIRQHQTDGTIIEIILVSPV